MHYTPALFRNRVAFLMESCMSKLTGARGPKPLRTDHPAASVLVLGAGKVGKSVAELLLALGAGAYSVTLADREKSNLELAERNMERLRATLKRPIHFTSRLVDASKPAAVRAALKGHDYVVCMLPFDLTRGLAELANDMGIHYFDVTEDVQATERVIDIHKQKRAKAALVPQCGLAPGYIAIAANHVAKQFSEVHDLKLRVGALPQYPTNALKYNVTWSTSGLVNEYCEPCNVMLDGKPVKCPALEGLEWFSFEGVEYEAFYTSGGVGTLIESLLREKKVTQETSIAYKTIRYPGHRDLMKFLLQDLRLGHDDSTPNQRGVKFDRRLCIDLLDHAIPHAPQDIAVIFINCIGIRNGRREQQNFERKVRAVDLWGRTWPAIELTTAAGVCGMVELHRTAALPNKGFIRQEEADLEAFNATPFGRAYEAPDSIESVARG